MNLDIGHMGRQEYGKKAVAFVLGAIVCVAVGFLAGASPSLAILVLAGAVVLGFALTRLTFSVSVLAACFFFANYLSKGSGTITIDKGIGVLAVCAWFYEWGTGRRKMVGVPQLWMIGGLLAWLLVSFSNAADQQVALTYSLRYLIFFVLFFLVIQTVQGNAQKVENLVTVAVLAGTVSAVVGLESFLFGGQSRATGPILDPNDFGFLLATTMPMAVFKARWAKTKKQTTLFTICAGLILACIGATFSRGALVALAAAGAWVLLTRRVRIRWVFGALAIAAAVFGLLLVFDSQLILGAFTQKAHIASSNTNNRLYLWGIALKEFEHFPITGVGPGNFPIELPFFGQSPGLQGGVLTTHNVYLNILAELGLPGELFFLGFIGYSWLDLRKRLRGSARLNAMQTAFAAAMIAAVVGSIFLTEQYYPPIWFIAALGISLSRVRYQMDPGSDIDQEEHRRPRRKDFFGIRAPLPAKNR